METERNSSIGMQLEELKHCLLSTTLELDNTKIAMEEELNKRDNQLLHLKALLHMAIAERDEAQERCQTLLRHHHQQLFIAGATSSAQKKEEDDELTRKEDQIINGSCFFFSSSSSSGDCEDETLVSMLPPEKPLPEKGKLLQAVMRAGPLLQTLLLAGPLPQWRRPPPPIDSSQIPPVKIPSPPPVFVQDSMLNCGEVCGKRGFPNSYFESPATESKCQRQTLLL